MGKSSSASRRAAPPTIAMLSTPLPRSTPEERAFREHMWEQMRPPEAWEIGLAEKPSDAPAVAMPVLRQRAPQGGEDGTVRSVWWLWLGGMGGRC